MRMRKHKLCIVLVTFLCLLLSVSAALAAPTPIKPRPLAQINILSPTGGEWKCGATMPITFSISTDKLKWVNILVKKGENTFYSFPHIAVSNTAPPTTFNWSIPKDAIIGDAYTVEIVSEETPTIRKTSNVFSIISAVATVTGAKPPQTVVPKTDVNLESVKNINVTSPSSLDRWIVPVDESITVSWDHLSMQKVATVDILLLKGDGTIVKPLASKIPFAAGTYSWKISGSDIAAGEYRIKVMDSAASGIQGASESFWFDAPTLIMISPVGNQLLIEGTTTAFSWTYTGSSKQKIRIMDGYKVVYDNININYGNLGTGKGTVPLKVPALLLQLGGVYETTKTFKVATTDNAVASPAVTTNVLTPAPHITSPLVDATWHSGDQHNVAWTYNGNPADPVDIYLVFFRPPYVNESQYLGTTTAGAGSYAIPNGPMNDYAYKYSLQAGLQFRIKVIRNSVLGLLSQVGEDTSGTIIWK